MIALAALILISCGSTSTASPVTLAPTSLVATPSPANQACPPTYPSATGHGETVWSGRGKILSIESVSEELFTATLVGSDAFTTNPLRLHFNDAGKHHLASFAVQPGDLVELRLASRGDDCSYQVTLMAKVP
jgi:hypothetical protein